MATLEGTLNVPLCGLFLAIFSLICFDAFSAVTVQYSHTLSRQNVNYSHTFDSRKNSYLFVWGGKHSTLTSL